MVNSVCLRRTNHGSRPEQEGILSTEFHTITLATAPTVAGFHQARAISFCGKFVQWNGRDLLAFAPPISDIECTMCDVEVGFHAE